MTANHPDWHAIKRACQFHLWEKAHRHANRDPDAWRYIEECKAVVLAQLTTAWQASKKEGTTNG